MGKFFLKLLLSILLIITNFSNLSALNADTAIDDTTILEVLTFKMASKKELAALKVKIKEVGIVSFQGEVRTSADVNTAIELAFSTPGVVDVDTSCLTVQEGKQPTIDTAITAKIKGIYVKKKILDTGTNSVTSIQVSTSKGVVYLTGKVDTKAQAEKAELLAKSIKGVKEVKSNLSVLNDWRSLS